MKKKLKRIAIISIPVIVIVSILCINAYTHKKDYRGFDYKKLDTGDILFARGRSVKSFFVLLINRNTNNYSHCGIIYKENNKCFIIHSTPTPVDKKEGRLVKELLTDFFVSNKVTIASVYRIDSSHQMFLKKSMVILNNYLHQEILFDDDFKLNNSKLYCTELVYKIYNKSGLPLISEDDFNKIIFPCDLIKSAYLRHVLTY